MAESDNNSSVYQLVRAGGTALGESPLLGPVAGRCSASRWLGEGWRPVGPTGAVGGEGGRPARGGGG